MVYSLAVGNLRSSGEWDTFIPFANHGTVKPKYKAAIDDKDVAAKYSEIMLVTTQGGIEMKHKLRMPVVEQAVKKVATKTAAKKVAKKTI